MRTGLTWALEGFAVLVGSVALRHEAVGHTVGPGRGHGEVGPHAGLPAPGALAPGPKLALEGRLCAPTNKEGGFKVNHR